VHNVYEYNGNILGRAYFCERPDQMGPVFQRFWRSPKNSVSPALRGGFPTCNAAFASAACFSC